MSLSLELRGIIYPACPCCQPPRWELLEPRQPDTGTDHTDRPPVPAGSFPVRTDSSFGLACVPHEVRLLRSCRMLSPTEWWAFKGILDVGRWPRVQRRDQYLWLG